MLIVHEMTKTKKSSHLKHLIYNQHLQHFVELVVVVQLALAVLGLE